MSALHEAPRDTQSQRKHLVIAGTGRAGTSFLVRFLTDLGLDTHISRFGDGAWDETAQAGLENGFWDTSADLPYVVKSPWAYQFIEQTLSNSAIEIEAVVIPIRNLIDAATSRTIIELRHIHQCAPWMAEIKRTWSDRGPIAGGTVFSLNPVDQARVLAVGFHHLIERLVDADVPMVFIAFPRLAEDPEYLFKKLKPVLPVDITLEQVRRSHHKLADPNLVRVGRERRHQAGTPSFEELDNIALKREIRHLRDRLTAVEGAAGRLRQTCNLLEQSRCHKIGHLIRSWVGLL
ncbi:MAG: hypothetical protein JO007_02880 [Alphaproteobacteria bacterium]|nr:hypothetical protein [Alphaproteobacteria bacterium]